MYTGTFGTTISGDHGTPFVVAKISGTRMMKVRERKFFSKPRRYLQPPRRRLRFAVWLQVASAVFARVLRDYSFGKRRSRACFFIYSSIATMPIRTTGCAISPRVSTSRYIETAANCPRNRCFLSLFPRPSKRGVSCLSLEAHPISDDLSVPTPRTDQNLVRRRVVSDKLCKLPLTFDRILG